MVAKDPAVDPEVCDVTCSCTRHLGSIVISDQGSDLFSGWLCASGSCGFVCLSFEERVIHWWYFRGMLPRARDSIARSDLQSVSWSL